LLLLSQENTTIHKLKSFNVEKVEWDAKNENRINKTVDYSIGTVKKIPGVIVG